MHIFGKILGTFFGFLLGGPIGAIFGIFLGHQFDKARRQYRGSPFSSVGGNHGVSQEEFFRAAFSVMGHVAKAKGNVTKEEIRLASVMMDRMNLNDIQRQLAQEAFREGKESGFPLENVLEQVMRSTGGRGDLIQFFLELQISAAFADGDLHPSEREILHKVARGLSFSELQLEQRLRMQEAAFRFQRHAHSGQDSYQDNRQGGGFSQAYSSSHLSDAYHVLGVDEGADVKTVKKAYRKLMNEHHPDKLMAKGLPPEMMTMAKEKSQEIQQAYELIKKAKGF
ncbi:co-chaperone DjlA [Vibrio rhizosphaerae]|uniref:Co-chaperone protein DjlA n=1 Tax=Vibrio rhizosphaerae TaxID=398736 RepID=A0ABU4IPV9_9VIBR|nr:co-chaperone DjlA [Vibrio rhizosphaerae]MDW6090998.1 co-chaperone DjlA [Vibrio rhizosphaerae]